MERRFTVRFRFKIPDEDSRKKLWQVLKPQNADYSNDVSIDELAKKYNFTGSQIADTLPVALTFCKSDHNKGITLNNVLLSRCADKQFPTFFAEGLMKNEGHIDPERSSLSDREWHIQQHH